MMKNMLLICSLAFGIANAHAQTDFFEGNWQEALAEAQKQNKYLFIDCYTDWCGWCKVADKKTFPDKAVADFLNKNFVSVKVDMERGKGVELAQKYRVMGFPSYLMFAPDGSFAHRMSGYESDPSVFVDNVKKALDGKLRPNYPLKLSDSVAFPPFYTAAFTDRDLEEKPIKPEPGVIDAWLTKQQDLLSVAAWSVIYRFQLNEANNTRFLQNRAAFTDLYGETEVADKLNGIANAKMNVAMESQKAADLQLVLDFVDRYMPENKEMTKEFYKLKFSEGKGDWQEYAQVAQHLIDLNGLENHLDAINNYSWTIYENTSDGKVLDTAIGWMGKVTALDPQYMYLDTYAALYFKAGKYDQALTWADKALEVGRASGENVQGTEELRDEIMAATQTK